MIKHLLLTLQLHVGHQKKVQKAETTNQIDWTWRTLDSEKKELAVHS